MGGLFSHYKSVNAKRYSQDPANFAYGEDKVWDELTPLEKVSSMSKSFADKGTEFLSDVGKHVAKVGAGIADVAERTSPIIEPIRNLASGVQEVVAGDEGLSAMDRFEKGVVESKARKTHWESISGNELTNDDGSINWKAGREFIGNAMEAPTYLYSAAGKVLDASTGLLSRILSRTVSALPEAGINTGIQALEEGTTDNVGMNMLANALLLSGVSNIAGEIKIKIPAKELSEATSEIEKEVGKALSVAEKADVEDALKQGIKTEDVILTLKKIKNNEITPQEVADMLNTKLLELPKKRSVIEGEGFTMSDEASKEAIARSKAFLKYNKELAAYNKNPTEKQLNKVIEAKKIKDEMYASIKDSTAPQVNGKEITDSVQMKQPAEAPIKQENPLIQEAPTQEIVAKTDQPLPTVGKVSKASSDINKSLVRAGFDELPEEELARYNPITKEKTINDVAEVMGDWDNAKKMAISGENIPSGVKEQVLFNAVKNKALKDNDFELMKELAGSPIATRRSLAAQELGSAGFNNELDDPILYMQDVAKVRENVALSRMKESSISDARTKIQKEIKNNTPKLATEDFDSFLNSIKCNI